MFLNAKITEVHTVLTVNEELTVFVNTRSNGGERHCIKIQLGSLAENGQAYSNRCGIQQLIELMMKYNVRSVKNLVGKPIRISVLEREVLSFSHPEKCGSMDQL